MSLNDRHESGQTEGNYKVMAEELRTRFDEHLGALGLRQSVAGSVVHRIDERYSYELFNTESPAYIALLRRPLRPTTKAVIHFLTKETVPMKGTERLGQAYVHVRLGVNDFAKIRHYSEIMVDVEAGAFEDDINRGALFGLKRDETAETGRTLNIYNLDSAMEYYLPDDDVFNRTGSDMIDALSYANRMMEAVHGNMPLHVETGIGCDS